MVVYRRVFYIAGYSTYEADFELDTKLHKESQAQENQKNVAGGEEM